jgi:hypothetical protein
LGTAIFLATLSGAGRYIEAGIRLHGLSEGLLSTAGDLQQRMPRQGLSNEEATESRVIRHKIHSGTATMEECQRYAEISEPIMLPIETIRGPWPAPREDFFFRAMESESARRDLEPEWPVTTFHLNILVGIVLLLVGAGLDRRSRGLGFFPSRKDKDSKQANNWKPLDFPE